MKGCLLRTEKSQKKRKNAMVSFGNPVSVFCPFITSCEEKQRDEKTFGHMV